MRQESPNHSLLVGGKLDTPVKKKIHPVLKLVFALVLTVLIMSIWQAGQRSSSDPVSKTETVSTPITHSVRYEVEAIDPSGLDLPMGADITISTPTGTSQQSISLPLRNKNTGIEGITMTVPSGEFLYISAQNSEGFGGVRCRIFVDEVLVSQNSSSAGYSIATCEGRS